MQIITSKEALTLALKNRANIGFVPTMGNLHAGHIHLVSLAKQHADFIVVSIFVNPLQFAASEDLTNYPRTLEADYDKLKVAGVDIVFVPGVTELYPDFDGKNLNQTITVMPSSVADRLCGATRPGHFAGVATVLAKLFNIIQPQVAVFGKKDFQQLFIIKEMVKQLHYPIQIVAAEIVREPNGLAMSSRNGYLSETARTSAHLLSQTLQEIVNAIKDGNVDFGNLENQAAQQLTTQGWIVDYISICAADSLMPATLNDKNLVLLAAAKIDRTRLIDNIEFCAK
ncbi:MAG: pantoate--beta-alanine ligase [Pseudomonadota bacterium]